MKFLRRFEYLFALLFMGSIALAGCSSVPDQEASAPPAAQTPRDPAKAAAQAVKTIPERPLSAEELEVLLEAELAGYRGEGEKATELYVKAAELTRDIGVVTRAFEVASAVGDDERALQMASLWREIQPGILPDRFAAQLFARVGETEAAWELAHNIDDQGRTLRIVAIESLGLNDPDRLSWLDQQLSGLENPSYDIWIARALLNDALEDIEQASMYAERAYQLNPGDVTAAELYASILARQGKDVELSAMLNHWLTTYWTGESNQIRVARLVAQLPMQEAINLLQAAVVQREHTEELQLLLSQAYLNNHQEVAAKNLLLRLVEKPEYADVSHIQLAQVAEHAGMLEQAFEHYRAVRPGRLFVQANQFAGQTVLATGSTSDLNDFFQKQRTQYSNASEQLYLVQAALLNDAQSSDELYALTSEALKNSPENTELLYLRSLASDRMGRFDLMEQDLRHILHNEPKNSQVLNALGYHLADRTDQYEEAYDLIYQALTLDPENPAIIDSMGWALYKLERYDDALAYLQEALSRYYDEEIVVHLAHTLIKLDRGQDAYELIQKALSNQPDSDMLQKAEQQLDFGLTPS
jgi:Tfp pilus assembly protein PilF